MVRIVSGAQQDPNIALLQGMQFGQQAQEARRRRQADEQAAFGQMIQMRKLQMGIQAEMLKREQMLNQQVQQGNAQAIQRAVLERQLSPEDKFSQQLLEIASKTDDPKAHAGIMAAGQDLWKQQTAEKEHAAAMQAIDVAAADGLLDPNDQPPDPTKPRDPAALPTVWEWRNKLASGEPAQSVSRGLMELRAKSATDEAFSQENLGALEQAEALIDTLPPGDPRRARLAPLVAAYRQSSSLHKEQGSSRRLLTAIHSGLGPPPQKKLSPLEDPKIHAAVFKELLSEGDGEEVPTPAQIRERIGQKYGVRTKGREPKGGMPPPFTGGTHATLRGTNRKGAETAAPQQDDALAQLLASATSDEDLISKVNASGLPKTPENLAAIQERSRALSRK